MKNSNKFPVIIKKYSSDSLRSLDIKPIHAELTQLRSELESCYETSVQFSKEMDQTCEVSQLAANFFTIMCSRARSVASLMPDFNEDDYASVYWDSGTVFSIARSIMEARIAFHCLVVDGCKPDEKRCRIDITKLHGSTYNRKLIEVIGLEATGQNKECLSMLDSYIKSLKESIKRNPCFEKSHWPKEILSGSRFLMYSLESRAEKAGIDRETYKLFNSEFNLHVHANPMQHTMVSYIGNENLGVTEIGLLTAAIVIINYCIISTERDILSMILSRLSFLKNT